MTKEKQHEEEGRKKEGRRKEGEDRYKKGFKVT